MTVIEHLFTASQLAFLKAMGSATGKLVATSRIASSARIWFLRPSSKVISVSIRPAARPEKAHR
jgi:hypothetical protein